jgi:hypothetical protein
LTSVQGWDSSRPKAILPSAALSGTAWGQDAEIAQGKQLLNGKHLQGKLMAKVANMLFDELVKAIALQGD